jgi:spermidine/putrescine-binding protein
MMKRAISTALAGTAVLAGALATAAAVVPPAEQAAAPTVTVYKSPT